MRKYRTHSYWCLRRFYSNNLVWCISFWTISFFSKNGQFSLMSSEKYRVQGINVYFNFARLWWIAVEEDNRYQLLFICHSGSVNSIFYLLDDRMAGAVTLPDGRGLTRRHFMGWPSNCRLWYVSTAVSASFIWANITSATPALTRRASSSWPMSSNSSC